jgi:phosphoribosylaminoimidazole-succinocarboxamide synthase
VGASVPSCGWLHLAKLRGEFKAGGTEEQQRSSFIFAQAPSAFPQFGHLKTLAQQAFQALLSMSINLHLLAIHEVAVTPDKPLTKISLGLEYATISACRISVMNFELLDSVLLQTDFPELKLHASGKVRDVYVIDQERLLFVATDRISAFDYVLATGIPHKGRVLTQISLFWFEFLRDLVPNHLVTADMGQYPKELQKYADQLQGRSMIVARADMFPVECVVRGYLSGSAWKEYKATGRVCGIELPKGLQESDRLPEPIFTPATKAVTGHDENIPFAEMARIVGPEAGGQLRDLSLAIYQRAAEYARQRGIIIADTKFEFGRTAQGITLADEVLTPDSSRFWPADQYKPGKTQESFDKQYVRDYLEEIRWNKQPPAPALPAEVARKTSEKYVEAYHLLSGRELDA